MEYDDTWVTNNARATSSDVICRMPVVYLCPFKHQRAPASFPRTSASPTDASWSPVSLSRISTPDAAAGHTASEKGEPLTVEGHAQGFRLYRICSSRTSLGGCLYSPLNKRDMTTSSGWHDARAQSICIGSTKKKQSEINIISVRDHRQSLKFYNKELG